MGKISDKLDNAIRLLDNDKKLETKVLLLVIGSDILEMEQRQSDLAAALQVLKRIAALER